MVPFTETPDQLRFLALLQGFRLRNSWESYVLSAPTSNAGNYSLTVYDRQVHCTYCDSEHVHPKAFDYLAVSAFCNLQPASESQLGIAGDT